MGSSANADLPLASAPHLILTRPTEEEKAVVWKQTHTMWGSALSQEMYLGREAYLTKVPLAMNGGITHWILTDGTLPPNKRPILSSVESLRKPALVSYQADDAPPSPKTVVDGITHGIASVFTDPQYRGKGYAGRMLRELGPRLVHWQVKSTEDADENKQPGPDEDKSKFSVLFSDIGKSFYSSKGWEVFPSAHYSFPPDPAAVKEKEENEKKPKNEQKIEYLGYHEMADLCSLDEKNLRERMANRAAAHPGKPCAALVPNLNTMLWHLMREDYMVKHIFGGTTPTIRGAVWGGVFNRDRRMWAIWTRGYYGGIADDSHIKDNTLHILRFVLEDIDDDVAESVTPHHVAGFKAIIRLAQAEASTWKCAHVELWNPTAALQRMAKESGLSYELHDREEKSIASLMWYGDGPTGDVEWVANEKYGWC